MTGGVIREMKRKETLVTRHQNINHMTPEYGNCNINMNLLINMTFFIIFGLTDTPYDMYNK